MFLVINDKNLHNTHLPFSSVTRPPHFSQNSLSMGQPFSQSTHIGNKGHLQSVTFFFTYFQYITSYTWFAHLTIFLLSFHVFLNLAPPQPFPCPPTQRSHARLKSLASLSCLHTSPQASHQLIPVHVGDSSLLPGSLSLLHLGCFCPLPESFYFISYLQLAELPSN